MSNPSGRWGPWARRRTSLGLRTYTCSHDRAQGVCHAPFTPVASPSRSRLRPDSACALPPEALRAPSPPASRLLAAAHGASCPSAPEAGPLRPARHAVVANPPEKPPDVSWSKLSHHRQSARLTPLPTCARPGFRMPTERSALAAAAELLPPATGDPAPATRWRLCCHWGRP